MTDTMDTADAMGAVGAVGPLPQRSKPPSVDSAIITLAVESPFRPAIDLMTLTENPREALYSQDTWRERLRNLTSNIYVRDDLVGSSWSAFVYQEEYLRMGWIREHVPSSLTGRAVCVTPIDVPTSGSLQGKGRGGRAPGVVILTDDGTILLGNASLDRFSKVRVPPPARVVEVCDKWAMVPDEDGRVLLYASKRKNRGVYEYVNVEMPDHTSPVRAFYYRGRHCVQDLDGTIRAISKYGRGPSRRYVADRTISVDVLTLDAPSYNPNNKTINPYGGLVHIGPDGQLAATRGIV